MLVKTDALVKSPLLKKCPRRHIWAHMMRRDMMPPILAEPESLEFSSICVDMDANFVGEWKCCVYPKVGLSYILMMPFDDTALKSWEIGPVYHSYFVVLFEKMTREQALRKLQELDDQLVSTYSVLDAHTSMVEYMLRLCQYLHDVEDKMMNFYEAKQVLLRCCILFYMRYHNITDFERLQDERDRMNVTLMQLPCFRLDGEPKQMGQIKHYFFRSAPEYHMQPFKDYCKQRIIDTDFILSEKQIWEKMATGGRCKKQQVSLHSCV